MWIRNEWVYDKAVDEWVRVAHCDINRRINDETVDFMRKHWVDEWHILTIGPDVFMWLPKVIGTPYYLATIHKEVR